MPYIEYEQNAGYLFPPYVEGSSISEIEASKKSVNERNPDGSNELAAVELNSDKIAEDVEIDEEVDAVEEMAKKLRSEEGKVIRLGGWIVEPVFGDIKYNFGFDRFKLRGIEKAGGEWLLACLAYNIKKIHRYINQKKEGGGVLRFIKGNYLGREIERGLVCCGI